MIWLKKAFWAENRTFVIIETASCKDITQIDFCFDKLKEINEILWERPILPFIIFYQKHSSWLWNIIQISNIFVGFSLIQNTLKNFTSSSESCNLWFYIVLHSLFPKRKGKIRRTHKLTQLPNFTSFIFNGSWPRPSRSLQAKIHL